MLLPVLIPLLAFGVPNPDRPRVEVRASLSDDALAGQLAQGRSYETHMRYRAMVTLGRAAQDRIFGETSMPAPTLRFGVAAGVSASTPSDTSRLDIDRNDRPYTGFTYGGLVAEVSDGARNRLSVELDYTAIGRQSGADRFHVAWKHAIGGPTPQGWRHQLRNERHINLRLDWDRTLLEVLPVGHGHLVDVQTHARVELAELAVAGGGGATVRVGLLRRPFLGVPDEGADAARETCGGWSCRQRRSVQAFVFARAEASVVGRRTTIDGSLFDRPDDTDRSPHRANARAFVPAGEVGVVLQPMEHLDVQFALRHQGPEVDAPGSRGHTVGRVALTGRF